jgi:sulfur relay (sulfurtransferase) complex TusBCD TusD component (DsrE family)
MVRKIVFMLLAVVSMPMSDGMAQTKSKEKPKQVNCDEQARANCPTYGVSAMACYRAALARCRKGGRS